MEHVPYWRCIYFLLNMWICPAFAMLVGWSQRVLQKRTETTETTSFQLRSWLQQLLLHNFQVSKSLKTCRWDRSKGSYMGWNVPIVVFFQGIHHVIHHVWRIMLLNNAYWFWLSIEMKKSETIDQLDKRVGRANLTNWPSVATISIATIPDLVLQSYLGSSSWFLETEDSMFATPKRGTGWWFQILFIFTSIWGRFPFWPIFFNWVETTN